MKPIFKTTYGSFLYGTNVETSDTDIKGVFVPTADQLLEQEVPSTDTNNTNKSSDRKNTSEDVDIQLTSLKKFLFDLANGQTYALELLFAPKQFWIEEPHPLWFKLLENKDKLISKNVTAMVSYARAQAYKYGEKGKRLEVFKDVVEWLESYLIDDEIKNQRIFYSLEIAPKFHLLAEKHKDFISIHKKENDISNVEYLDINGVMVPVNSTFEYAYNVYKPRLEEYGDRAKQAAKDKGNDLKAIYHAIRIANQAEELLRTGNITLPRPEADLLLKVRKGLLSEQEMKSLVDESFERVRQAERISPSLRENVDKKWLKSFLRECNLQIIKEEKNLIEK
jgi:predicted nucleotidyltransferase